MVGIRNKRAFWLSIGVIGVLSSVCSAQEKTVNSEQASIDSFEARNAVRQDALSLFAFDNKSRQNLYVSGDDVDQLWSVWRLLFLPSYTRVLVEGEGEVYLLTYNPLAEVGTLSKWRRVNGRLRYEQFGVATAEFLRGERIAGEPHGPSWLNRFENEHVVDLLSSSRQTVSDTFARLNSPKAVESALNDLMRPRPIDRSQGKPFTTDRDVALLRVAGMAATLSKGVGGPESKTTINHAVECLDGRSNELCPSTPALPTGSKRRKHTSQSNVQQPPITPSMTDTAGPWVPEDYLRTGKTEMIFIGSVKVPGIINVVSVSNRRVTSVTRINFDEKFDQFVLKDLAGKF